MKLNLFGVVGCRAEYGILKKNMIFRPHGKINILWAYTISRWEVGANSQYTLFSLLPHLVSSQYTGELVLRKLNFARGGFC